MKLVIFTDLDGTLLSYSDYSWKLAQPALDMIDKNQIPLIFVTSKTLSELEKLNKALKNIHPFITENGAAIFIPKGYLDLDIAPDKEYDNYHIIELGKPYDELIGLMEKIRSEFHGDIRSFEDISDKELAEMTGLSLEQARLSKKRDYTLPFLFDGDIQEIKTIIKKHHLNYTKGALFHYIMGDNDKSKAIKILKDILTKKLGQFKTIALGDSLNDLEMLQKADISFLVKKQDNTFEDINLPNLKKIDDIGPIAWNKAILNLLAQQ